MHFGLRGRQEHTDMCWGDIELQTDAEGSEYLLFTERATKTRHGVSRLTRLFQPKMFATGICLTKTLWCVSFITDIYTCVCVCVCVCMCMCVCVFLFVCNTYINK